MNIKKVDDKPMVIHTKEKPKLKVKGAPETKIKGRNVLTVQHGSKAAGTVAEKGHCAAALFHDGKVYRAVCGAVPACAVCGSGAHCASGHCGTE